MKFVKENLTLVIVGAVVLLFMVAAFAYPMPQWRSSLRADMGERANQGTTVKNLAGKPLELPGVESKKGAPNAPWVEKKKNIIDDVNKAKGDVDKEAQEGNSRMRVDKGGIPLLPMPRAVDLGPANVGVQLTNPDKKSLLPNPSDPMEFKFKYQQLFRIWTNLLVAGKIDDPGASPPASTPPKMEDLAAAFTAQEMRSAAALPPGGAGLGTPTVNAALTNKRFYDFAKAAVMNRASGLQMYVEPSPLGFQIRDWAFRDQAPSPQQVFEGLVDTWIQADIVKAIVVTNNKSMGVGLDRNVGKAAVKRLTRIMIGNNARTRVLGSTTAGATGAGMMAAVPAGGGQVADPGPLFFTSGNANSMGSTNNQVLSDPNNPNAAAQPVEASDNLINYELSVTGRSAGKAYDVVHVSILVDIDPAQLNAFVRALYMQNMGYVQESLQIKTVDPTERASYGYLYGDGQVVEAEIQFEALFFRSWTAPLMPTPVRQALGVPAPTTTPAQ